MRTLGIRLPGTLIALLLLATLGCDDDKVAPGSVCETHEDCVAGMCVDNRCGMVCGTHDDCRQAGLGTYCDDGQCVMSPPETEPLAISLRVDGELFEEITGPIEVEVGEDKGEVTLDADETTAPGDTPLSFEWFIMDDGGLGGLLNAIVDPRQANAKFRVPRVYHDTTVLIELRVKMGRETEVVEIALTILNTINEPPEIAILADSAQVSPGEHVVLEAVADDPNDDPIALPFGWRQISGPTVELTDASGDGSHAAIGFTAPGVTTTVALRFEVAVSDDHETPETGYAQIVIEVVPLCTSRDDCAEDEICQDGLCVDCTPDCAGRDCGLDPVCEVSCGECTPGEWCDDGTCVPEAFPGACDNVDDGEALASLDDFDSALQCMLDAAWDCDGDLECLGDCVMELGISSECSVCWGEFALCGIDNCAPTKSSMSHCDDACKTCMMDNCEPGFGECAGIDWRWCEPQCDPGYCGPDGCGGFCECAPGEWCDEDTCVPETLPGACDGEGDQSLLLEITAAGLLDTCGECLSDIDPSAACFTSCAVSELGFSPDCAECVGERALCSHDHCADLCLALENKGGDSCEDCVTSNCGEAFADCIGPQPND